MEAWTPIHTRLFIAGLVVCLIVLDVLLAALVGNDATLSKQMQWIGDNWSIVVVAWGGLGAHFFFARYHVWPGWYVFVKPILLLGTGFTAFALGWMQWQQDTPKSSTPG